MTFLQWSIKTLDSFFVVLNKDLENLICQCACLTVPLEP